MSSPEQHGQGQKAGQAHRLRGIGVADIHVQGHSTLDRRVVWPAKCVTKRVLPVREVPVANAHLLLSASSMLALLCLAAAPASGPARFSERIAPLAEQRCDNCHAKAPGGSMASYRTARSFVTPGKPAESPYYALPKGHPPSWGDAADLVREWIASGARE